MPLPISGLEIERWVQTYIAGFLNTSPEQIDRQADLERFGLDSAVVVSLVSELEEWLGLDLSPSLLFEYPTIAELAEYLSRQTDLAGRPAVEVGL